MKMRLVSIVVGGALVAVVAAMLSSRFSPEADSTLASEDGGMAQARPEARPVAATEPPPAQMKPSRPQIGVPEVYVDGQRVEGDVAPSAEDISIAGEDPEQVRALGVLFDRSASDVERHQAANLLRRLRCPELQAALLSVLQREDEGPRFRSWAVQHLYVLASIQKPVAGTTVEPVLRDALDDRHIPVRREALLALSRLGAEGVLRIAVDWLDEPPVADLAIRILREQGASGHADRIRPLLTDEQAPVAARIAAIVTLADWRDPASREILLSLVQVPRADRAGRIARSARQALDNWKDL